MVEVVQSSGHIPGRGKPGIPLECFSLQSALEAYAALALQEPTLQPMKVNLP